VMAEILSAIRINGDTQCSVSLFLRSFEHIGHTYRALWFTVDKNSSNTVDMVLSLPYFVQSSFNIPS
jgi:hypothetical protein